MFQTEREENGFKLIRYSPRVAVLFNERNRNHWPHGYLVYLGFPEEGSAHTLGKWLQDRGIRSEVRLSKRTPNSHWDHRRGMEQRSLLKCRKTVS